MNPVTKTKSLWPYGLIAFFVLFGTWLAIFVSVAVSNSSELVAADYYEQEIRYQERIDSLQRATAAGGLAMEFDQTHSVLKVRLPAQHAGGEIDGYFKFYRPNNSQLDRRVKLAPDDAGGQSLSTTELSDGVWKLEAHWQVKGENFYASTNLVLKSKPL